MQNTGFLEIKVNGKKGNIPISPDNYDIRELMEIIGNVENLLFPLDKKDRPAITYEMQEGSVRHLFRTSLQYIIGFNAVLGEIERTNNLDFLDLNTAKAFEVFQELAVKYDYLLEVGTSLEKSHKLNINKGTQFKRSEAIWADAEFYFYGKVTNAGGKDRANMHLLTEELGTIRIGTPISFLKQYESNLLYKSFGVRAMGRQNSQTGEIDLSSLKFIELSGYDPKYDESYLDGLIAKAENTWSSIPDKESWLREIRGGYE
ncbi:hypothetical protein SYJ56_19200 [Algoriphagus sp. D3-2-R+10]|uniref:hypothetical protein n=1 Tax=Algoriphagus aurantiacus TaxID=3103948 RepID=UPI002B396769|nr:hypothetical protein [Algoriphagus sp. D3-2-R+10]MEB2777450.1 hypothetical protein [Algoriphagus sp. D3-2-R+10]